MSEKFDKDKFDKDKYYISESTKEAAKQNPVSATVETFGSKDYDAGQKVAVLGESIGVPLSCASRLRQSTNDLKMAMFGTDEQIVNYYRNYDSVVAKAESEMAAAYSASEAIDAKVQQAKDAKHTIKATKKQKKLDEKQAKAAERQKKAEAMKSTLDDSGLSGVIKDCFGLE